MALWSDKRHVEQWSVGVHHLESEDLDDQAVIVLWFRSVILPRIQLGHEVTVDRSETHGW